ncbi:hypothetical protein F0L74_12055 [Chitinophaga agrisoli]|uniref:Uncharacterized protein n=1 Tax=Chitinophaga agrisoli TaxID=2607653 RepID=A0A5B2VVF1_9BACT|nr:hypothetical protein [Chitinophaga agrisoli]KAA2243241.1 hypothetical protein F0L74_12055 [Chitinophaga agrisoli]
MYLYLLFFHSLLRWLVLGSFLYALFRGLRGWLGKKRNFRAADSAARQLAVTMAHIQLPVGYVLYFNSPVISYFRTHYHEAGLPFDFLFFGLIHIILMTLSVVCITTGGAVARRKIDDASRFRAMTLWFAAALLIILIAIPWPFSPLAQRPLLRSF